MFVVDRELNKRHSLLKQNKKLEETEEKAMRKYEILLETARQQHDSETRQRVEVCIPHVFCVPVLSGFDHSRPPVVC